MKILNVNMSIDAMNGGGTAERTVQMSKALVEAGHECAIITLDIGITENRKQELKSVELIAFPCLSKRFYIPLISFSKMSNAVKSADIVHLMGHWTFINAITYIYIRRFKKKYVVCPAGALPIFGRSSIIKKVFNAIVGKAIIQNADGHIVVAETEVEHYSNYDVPKDKIAWIPNGIDPSGLKFKDDEKFKKLFHLNERPFIFYIGRLNLIKGTDLLIEAFSVVKNEFPEYDLLIAGPDEGLLDSLKNVASQNSIQDRVYFLGPILGEFKSYALNAANLMVIPSRQEAMSIVVLEGGITGLPVVLTNQCGLDYLANIDCGIVTEANIEGIANGLRKALLDPNKSKQMGKNLKIHIEENYLWTSIVKKFENLYIKILA